MNSDDDRLAMHAEALREAERTGKPIFPLTETDSSLDVSAAYGIQRLNIEDRLSSGAKVVGRKVGLTSKAMQEMLGVREPDFGVILDDMVVQSGEEIDIASLIQPRIEAEIAFVLERDLKGPGVTTPQALTSIAGALPSLEVIDSRIEEWRIGLVDTVADNASSARVVLGGQLTSIDGLDLRLVGVAVSRNGELVEVGVGAAALGHPANCVAWLANKLAEFGDGLRAGDIVMPGAVHRAINVFPGDSFMAEFAWLGNVDVRFSTIAGER